MLKKTLTAISISGLMTFGTVAIADEHNHKAGDDASTAKTEKKTGRKKRRVMCRDCGKPEVNCDCSEELKKKERERWAKEDAQEAAKEKKAE